MDQMERIIIHTEGLTKCYGEKTAVSELNLDIRKGEIFGLLGPNGAGKTTTILMLLGLTEPTSGTASINGRDCTRDPIGIKTMVGYLPDQMGFYADMTGRENLRFTGRLNGLKGTLLEERIDSLLERVRMTEAADKKTGTYSRGMKQRLGIARALLCRPELLILDEPTNGLDPAGIQEMRELICSLPERFGMTVVVSSHLLSEIDQMADHVAIIREGELVFQDTLEALHGRSRHHLALRTTNNAVARAILQEKSVPCQEEEGYLILPILSDELAAQLTRLLGARNLGVIRLEERQKSLEDIFLELTGKAASL